MRKFVNNQKTVTVYGNTVQEAFEDFTLNFPNVREHLFDESDELRGFLRIYKGATDIRKLEGEFTDIEDNDVLNIIPAIAGGKPMHHD